MKGKKIVFFISIVILLLALISYLTFNYLGIFKKQSLKNPSLNINNQKQGSCTRTEPFSLDPQFNKALDLIAQRSKSAEELENKNKLSSTNVPRFFPALDSRNCLNILYSDNMPKNSNAWFDSESSTSNNLIIKIIPEYKDQNIDNLVMAMLLAHELVHVQQYFDIKTGAKMTCVEQEADAFNRQLSFLAILNKDEQLKIMNLIKTKYYYVLGTFYDLWIEQDKASTACNKLQPTGQFNQDSFNKCFWDEMQTITKEFIQNIPGYQEHCKLK